MVLAAWNTSMANVPTNRKYSNPKLNEVRPRAGECANSKSAIDQEINNVRARLLGGGDCWWNFTNGRYIVPKVDPSSGQVEVSSVFAGSVWLGGVDPGGNLKLACQDYRNDGKNDFWPGPLTDGSTGPKGQTTSGTCLNWDRHFRVTGDEIRKHLRNLAIGNLDKDQIPRGVKGWPAQGNIYFNEVWGFDLPFTSQALAGFFDADEDGRYDPLKGDYPSIEIRGCALNRYPDEMIFWIYNDQGAGAPHARTGGKTIQMEVQVQAFGYVTSDELNDMTFQRYKLINRATERIDSMFFAMWVDPDLGCFSDDYIGCDSSRSLMYVYNQDATDGSSGCSCPGGSGGDVTTYCDKVPILGVDYFRGPLDTFGNEIGMSSFMYYNNGSVGTPTPGTTDPAAPAEYYNYITGTWRDGTPVTRGGSGYQQGGGGIPTRYVFPEAPNDPTGWSMCTANLPFGDRRTLQATGPFTLLPGAVNELIIGLPWVPDIEYPCPDLEGLFRADRLAQGLFDACFELLDGPDAPNVDWVELNQEVVAVLSNVAPSNNLNEQYGEKDILSPPTAAGLDTYRFEGYKIYQLANPNVSAADFENPEVSRLVYEVDVKNNVSKVYNWIETRDPGDPSRIIYFPEIKVDGQNQGIRHTFSIKDDKFATGNDKRLINHKKYYFVALAYGYNNFSQFDPLGQPTATGQQRPYLVGRKGAEGAIPIYTVIPRPIVDQTLRSAYGEGVEITRYDGAGTGGNFLDLTDDSQANILNLGPDSALTYKIGRGPFDISIFNPFEVKDGNYELLLVDPNLGDNDPTFHTLSPDARWQLRNLDDGTVIASERTIGELNEQVIAQYGFSLTVVQQAEPGEYAYNVANGTAGQGKYQLYDETNGAVGAEIEYDDPNKAWLLGYPNQEQGNFHYVPNRLQEENYTLDPTQQFDKLGDGYFVPYMLTDWRVSAAEHATPQTRLLTPAWSEKYAGSGLLSQKAMGTKAGTLSDPHSPDSRFGKMYRLPNVDIVLTSDKSKWSRCVIVESASLYYTDGSFPKGPGLAVEGREAGKSNLMFDTRYALSVGKDDTNGDGLPDPDGAVEPATKPNGAANPHAGQPLRGMGWFPGYAVNVETGQRLNIFFGENTTLASTVDSAYTGRDMLWNPTDQVLTDIALSNGPTDYFDAVLGGQHFVYVQNTPYDQGLADFFALRPDGPSISAGTSKVQQIGNISWTAMLQLAQGYQMKSLNEGLIPNDVTIKLRVSNPYQTTYDPTTGQYSKLPRYQFKINGRGVQQLASTVIPSMLDSVKAVPNPYYGFSQYEVSQFSNVVKITNLPAKCTVTIYSLDGKFIRQYKREEQYMPYDQIAPDIEWDMKNSKGIPVASGVYLIHVDAPGMGERTIKWFGIPRQFDPSGL